MKKIYKVALSEEEQAELQALISKGKTSARRMTRARILLLAHAGDPVEHLHADACLAAKLWPLNVPIFNTSSRNSAAQGGGVLFPLCSYGDFRRDQNRAA